MIRHKITRTNNLYYVYKLFVSESTKREHWVCRRVKNNGGTIGPIVSYKRLYKAVEAIRKEPRGEESQIYLDTHARNHLHSLQFKDEDIDMMLKNRKEETDGTNHTALS